MTQVMATMVLEAGASHLLATVTGPWMMRLERHGVAHILTLLGQSHQRPTTFVALEFG